MDWTEFSLTLDHAFLAAWFARPYFGSYLNKKGENRAIHEDLDRINRHLETYQKRILSQA